MNKINLPPRGAFWRMAKLAGLLLLPLAAMNAAAVNFPVGTHLIKGTLKDWQNKVLTSSAAVTIQAVATNGTVIASAKVADPTADGYSFLLQIPLSSTATDSTAAVGDTLNCVLVQESGLSLAANPLVVGEANAVSTVSLAYVNMKNYTSTDGTGTTASVPAEYVETIAAWMEAYEIEGDYDPFADYDNDGASNYAEYRAGTNPFDATDKLRSPPTPRRRTLPMQSASSTPAVTSTASPPRSRSQIPSGRRRRSRKPRRMPSASR